MSAVSYTVLYLGHDGAILVLVEVFTVDRISHQEYEHIHSLL